MDLYKKNIEFFQVAGIYSMSEFEADPKPGYLKLFLSSYGW